MSFAGLEVGKTISLISAGWLLLVQEKLKVNFSEICSEIGVELQN